MPDPQKVSEIFCRAFEIHDADERRRFVEEAAEGDAALFDEVWSLCESNISVRRNEEPAQIGETVGNYEITSTLHSGQLASVYSASHRLIKNKAAVKVFREAAGSAEWEEVWRRDSVMLSQFSHDSIVRFYDVGFIERGRLPYVIMEYVDGLHIDEYCDVNKLSCRRRLELLYQLCNVLQYVHGKDFAHLDLKPSNILITSSPEDKIKLIDFGAGKLLQVPAGEEHLSLSQFSIAFSRNYASPEQVKGQHPLVGVTSDIYSLGAVIYKLMTGRPPLIFKDDSREEAIRVISTEKPILPSSRVAHDEAAIEGEQVDEKHRPEIVSDNRSCQPRQLVQMLRGDIDAIVMKCLEKERGRRYKTAKDLANDIDNFLQGRPVRARWGGWRYRFSKLIARWLGFRGGLLGWDKWRVPLSRLALITLFLGAIAYAWYATRPGELPTLTSSKPYRVLNPNEGGRVIPKDRRYETRLQTLAPGVYLELMLVPADPSGTTFLMGSTGEEIKPAYPDYDKEDDGSAEKKLDSLLFYSNDFKDLASLVRKLTAGIDPLSAYIASRLTPDTRQIIEKYSLSPGQPGQELGKTLAEEFNILVKGDSLYDPARFKSTNLKEDTRTLIGQKPKSGALVRLNRMLLEDAYSDEIEKNQKRAETHEQLKNESPQHKVTIKSFYMGRVEVTQAQWRAVAMMPKVQAELDPDPSNEKQRSAPVTNVSFSDAQEFCARLSHATGLNYRLPSEAEWEYACRANNTTPYGLTSEPDTRFINFNLKKAGKPLEMSVGNLFGLFSMNGNVWEWTQDLWHDNYNDYPRDNYGKAWEDIVENEEVRPDTNKFLRVIRGGSFDTDASWCRCASRTKGTAARPDSGRNGQTGFRVVLMLNNG